MLFFVIKFHISYTNEQKNHIFYPITGDSFCTLEFFRDNILRKRKSYFEENKCYIKNYYLQEHYRH